MHEDERDVTHSLTVPKLSRVCACVRVCVPRAVAGGGDFLAGGKLEWVRLVRTRETRDKRFPLCFRARESSEKCSFNSIECGEGR